MKKNLDPSASFCDPTVNMYLLPDGHASITHIKKLPANLLDALRLLEKDPDSAEIMGKKFITAFLKLKNREWQQYCAHLSQWELDNGLNC